MKLGRYVIVDDGGNCVTFHELDVLIIESLSTRVFEARTATQSDLFSLELALTQPNSHC